MAERVIRDKVKSVAFIGETVETQLDVMEEVLEWLREHPDVSIVGIDCGMLYDNPIETREDIVVFYE